METKLMTTVSDPFLNVYVRRNYAGSGGFLFEEDFVEENLRCIPMIVRFKMDLAGIKLKLAEWCRFETGDRKQLAERACVTDAEIWLYRSYLRQLVLLRTGHEATPLAVDKHPLWSHTDSIPRELQEQAAAYRWEITVEQWQWLSNLQRFTLLKLCRPGHENRNFPKAMREFGLDA